LIISDSEFEGSLDTSLGRGYGLWLDAFTGSSLSNVQVRSNDFIGNNNGIYLNTRSDTSVLTNVMIEENEISDNGIGVLASTYFNSGNTFKYNNIFDNLEGINNKSYVDLEATLNWWGHSSGPSEVGPGTGDTVRSNVVYQECLFEPYERTAMLNMKLIKRSTSIQMNQLL